MRIAVAGGTGVAGTHTVTAVRAAGHDPVVIARSAGVDVITGAGLAQALHEVEVVIDTSNVVASRRSTAVRFFETATVNLLTAARTAGVRHVVALSIVGVDRVPLGYYAGKRRQEELLAASDVSTSVLRATQFHEFAGQMLDRLAFGPVAVVPKVRLQPVAASEVGGVLVEVALGQPAPLTELAGPRELTGAEMVRQLLQARSSGQRVLELRLPGKAGRAMATGGNLPDQPGRRGTVTYQEWLATASP